MNYTSLGDYVKDNVPSLKHFMSKGYEDTENIRALEALSSARRLLQRCRVLTTYAGDFMHI